MEFVRIALHAGGTLLTCVGGALIIVDAFLPRQLRLRLLLRLQRFHAWCTRQRSGQYVALLWTWRTQLLVYLATVVIAGLRVWPQFADLSLSGQAIALFAVLAATTAVRSFQFYRQSAIREIAYEFDLSLGEYGLLLLKHFGVAVIILLTYAAVVGVTTAPVVPAIVPIVGILFLSGRFERLRVPLLAFGVGMLTCSLAGVNPTIAVLGLLLPAAVELSTIVNSVLISLAWLVIVGLMSLLLSLALRIVARTLEERAGVVAYVGGLVGAIGALALVVAEHVR